MSEFSLESVQKVLHLDVSYPNFATWEEQVEFVVDGVVVKAIAIHAWRRILVQVIEPFNLTSIYEPPLFALGFSMLGRKASLLKKGITEAEDAIDTAKWLYVHHVAYLRIKDRIEAAQEEIIKEFAGQLKSLLLVSDSVEARVAVDKSELRKKCKAGAIGQKDYQSALKNLKMQAWNASTPYYELKYQVDSRLSDIKQSMMEDILNDESKNS